MGHRLGPMSLVFEDSHYSFNKLNLFVILELDILIILSANTSSTLAREGETMKLSYMIITIFDNHVSFMIRIINDTKEDVTKMLRHIFVTSQI